MIESWQQCKNILVIRADNMGDVIMSGPAIRALKESTAARITLLTSTMAAGIVPFIAEVDDVLVFDLPWIKAKETIANEEIFSLVHLLKKRKFDAAVIFTVFSQNPLPAAMIAYMADIPLRLAYCRENPYGLLTDWVPDKEPYTYITHQVERDLSLVKFIGSSTPNIRLHLNITTNNFELLESKLKKAGLEITKPWIIFHPGVSEKKREYPQQLWVEAGKKIFEQKKFQILYTGARSEKQLCDVLSEQTGDHAFSVAGLFTLPEFVELVKNAPIVVSVNTGTVHIAAAVNTPVVVLYAHTNPQHTPWMVPSRVLQFGVEKVERSKNEVIQYLYSTLYNTTPPMPAAIEIVEAVTQLLEETTGPKADPSHFLAAQQ